MSNFFIKYSLSLHWRKFQHKQDNNLDILIDVKIKNYVVISTSAEKPLHDTIHLQNFKSSVKGIVCTVKLKSPKV